MRLAVAQRLVRRLCSRCRKPRELTEAEAVALGNPEAAGATVYEPAGCLYCANRGFVGRIGLFEMLPCRRGPLAAASPKGPTKGAIMPGDSPAQDPPPGRRCPGEDLLRPRHGPRGAGRRHRVVAGRLIGQSRKPERTKARKTRVTARVCSLPSRFFFRAFALSRFRDLFPPRSSM